MVGHIENSMNNINALMQCVKEMQARQVEIIKNTLSATLCHSEVVAANQAAGQCVDVDMKSEDETDDAGNQNQRAHDAESDTIDGTHKIQVEKRQMRRLGWRYTYFVPLHKKFLHTSKSQQGQICWS